MGAFCCCARPDDLEEFAYPNSSVYRNCICFRFFFHQLFSGFVCVIPIEGVHDLQHLLIRLTDNSAKVSQEYRGMFHRLDGRPMTSQIQGAGSLSSSGLGTVASDNCGNDAHISMARPLPFDADQRYSRLQRDGLVSRREKTSAHLQDDLQPVRRNMSSSGVDSLGPGKRWNGIDSEEEGKFGHLESEKAPTTKVVQGLIYTQPSLEDEDICPTCLEEYTEENPKITAKCTHHFHLGCIYEWMERSESCPICGKEMEFCESP